LFITRNDGRHHNIHLGSLHSLLGSLRNLLGILPCSLLCSLLCIHRHSNNRPLLVRSHTNKEEPKEIEEPIFLEDSSSSSSTSEDSLDYSEEYEKLAASGFAQIPTNNNPPPPEATSPILREEELFLEKTREVLLKHFPMAGQNYLTKQDSIEVFTIKGQRVYQSEHGLFYSRDTKDKVESWMKYPSLLHTPPPQPKAPMVRSSPYFNKTPNQKPITMTTGGGGKMMMIDDHQKTTLLQHPPQPKSPTAPQKAKVPSKFFGSTLRGQASPFNPKIDSTLPALLRPTTSKSTAGNVINKNSQQSTMPGITFQD